MRLRERLAVVYALVGDAAREHPRRDIAEEVATVVDIEPGREVVRQRLPVRKCGERVYLVEERRLGSDGDQPLDARNRLLDQRVDTGDPAQTVGEERNRPVGIVCDGVGDHLPDVASDA